MPTHLRVTDDVQPKRTYTIHAGQYDESVHTLVEDEHDTATFPDGSPRPPRYWTTVDAEATKKKTTASPEAKTAAKSAGTEKE